MIFICFSINYLFICPSILEEILTEEEKALLIQGDELEDYNDKGEDHYQFCDKFKPEICNSNPDEDISIYKGSSLTLSLS